MKSNNSKHILIIDDSPDQQVLLKTLLKANGHTSECTSNGEDALVLLKSSLNKLPQLILLDLNMPVMDGYTFCDIQRKNPDLKDIPIIILSGDENIHSFKGITNIKFLKKPLTVSSLLQLINQTGLSTST